MPWVLLRHGCCAVFSLYGSPAMASNLCQIQWKQIIIDYNSILSSRVLTCFHSFCHIKASYYGEHGNSRRVDGSDCRWELVKVIVQCVRTVRRDSAAMLRCCMSFRIASTQATAVPVQQMIGLGRGCARAMATVRFLSLLPERSVEQLCRTMFFATKSLPPSTKSTHKLLWGHITMQVCNHVRRNMTCHCYYIIPFLSIDYGILPKLCHPPFRIRLLDIKPKLTRPRHAANVVTDVHPRIIVAVKGNILIPSNRPVVVKSIPRRQMA